MKKTVLAALFLLILLGGSAYAYDDSLYEQQLDAVGGDSIIGALPPESARYLGQAAPSVNTDVGQAFSDVLQNALQDQRMLLREGLHSLTRVMLVAVLCGCASGLKTAAGSSLPEAAIDMAGAIGVTGVLMGDLQGMMGLCTQTLEQVSVFSKTMLPVMAAAVSLSGAPTTATILQAATMFAFDLLVRFITAVLVPAVCAYITIITVNAALGSDALGKLAAFVRWLTTGSLKLLLTVFIAYITISGSLGGSVDGVALKTAKFAVSGSVPVVGGIISDATETILSGAALLKNTVGIFGMVCIAAICIVPFLRVGLNYLLFKAGAAVLSPVCSKSLSGLIGGISDSFGLLLGMLGTCCAILFFELVFSVSLVRAS